MIKETFKDLISDIDEPLDLDGKFSISFGTKFKIIIINEDLSHKIYHVKLKKTYTFTIKQREYIIVPKCVVRGKNPLLVYYFNNPFPIGFKYESCKLTAYELYSDKKREKLKKDGSDFEMMLSRIPYDAKTLHHLLYVNVVKNIYPKKGWSPKIIIIASVIFLVFILVLLHLTGVIDLTSFLIQKPA